MRVDSIPALSPGIIYSQTAAIAPSPTASRTFKDDARLLDSSRKRRPLLQVRPNRYDRLVRRLQSAAIRDWTTSGAADTYAGNDASLTEHLRLVDGYRRHLARKAIETSLPEDLINGRIAKADFIKRWAKRWSLCSPAGGGTRGDQRCSDRFCINCKAIDGARLYERIQRVIAARSPAGRVHFLRIGYLHRVFDSPASLADPRTGLPTMLDSLRASASRALRLLGPLTGDAVVLTSVDKITCYIGTHLQGSIGVAVAVTLVFASKRLSGVMYRNHWPVTSVPNQPERIGSELARRLRVPPGLLSLDLEGYHALRTALQKVRTFAFRGTWARSAKDNASSPADLPCPKTVCRRGGSGGALDER